MLEDEDNKKKEAMELFTYKQRTEHIEIPPARDRILDFSRKPIPQMKQQESAPGRSEVKPRPHTTENG